MNKKLDHNQECGIDFLRTTVKLLNYCNETFNQQFTPEQIILLMRVHDRQKVWDFLPDQWSARQVKEALKYGKVPEWKENREGRTLPVYQKGLAKKSAKKII